MPAVAPVAASAVVLVVGEPHPEIDHSRSKRAGVAHVTRTAA
jgi:hypothetical protein